MEKKLEFTESARSQINKITQSDDKKSILEFLYKEEDAQDLNIFLALMIKFN